MRRELLIQLLDEYKHLQTAESALIERFTEFVVSDAACFERSNMYGHITGSAWISSPNFDKILLMHHTKLDKWIQLGGHADGNHDVLKVALREAEEESGIFNLIVLSKSIFDLDIHQIPEIGDEPSHLHFDVRFALLAPTLFFVKNSESKALKWVAVEDIPKYSNEPSILRMAEKWVLMRSSLEST
jgi:8-oxo-dGTP pyrophosphatase MutT (NUDIX family)